MRTVRRSSTVLALAILWSAASCGGGGGDDGPPPPPPVTNEEAIDACQSWSRVVVGRFAQCLGWDQAMIDAEIREGDMRCIDGIQAQDESCRRAQRDAFQGCEERAPTYSCDELCPDELCFIGCTYTCP